MMHLSNYIIVPAGFASQGVLNKDPTVWLDVARPTNICIPSFLRECTSTAAQHIHPQKYICKYIKIKIAESYINDTPFGDILGHYHWIVLYGESNLTNVTKSDMLLIFSFNIINTSVSRCKTLNVYHGQKVAI